MPYEMKCDGDSCHVYKKGSTEPKNKKPMSKEAAKRYMAALYVNTEGGKKDITDLEYAVIEEKCMAQSYPPYAEKLTPEQANYNAMGGVSDGVKACSTCRWFNAPTDSCYVVYGTIVPTGLSDMYMPMPPPYKSEPMPVVIVKPSEADTDAESLAGKQPSVAAQIKQSVQSFPLKVDVAAKVDVAEEAESGFKVLPGGRWVGWWTNNAPDKTGEQFTLKAIDDFVARVDSKAVPYPELWYKHLHIPMGRADSVARIGYLGFATGTFYDTPTGQSGRKALEADIKAGQKKTMSHQFLYPKSMKQSGAIHAFNSFELSTLDMGEEANSITKFGVKHIMKVVLDEKKRAELLEKFGGDNEYVNKLLNFADVTSKAMEAAGLDLKSLEALPDMMTFEVQDKAAHQAIEELGQATLSGMKAITAQITELATQVKSVAETSKASNDLTSKAVTDLKAYVEEQFGYTPRASRAKRTQVPANDPAVVHLKTQNAASGKKTEGDELPDVPARTGAKSMIDEIAEIFKSQNGRT